MATSSTNASRNRICQAYLAQGLRVASLRLRENIDNKPARPNNFNRSSTVAKLPKEKERKAFRTYRISYNSRMFHSNIQLKQTQYFLHSNGPSNIGAINLSFPFSSKEELESGKISSKTKINKRNISNPIGREYRTVEIALQRLQTPDR